MGAALEKAKRQKKKKKKKRIGDLWLQMQLRAVLLWLWCRSAAAALIQPLAWELPYAAGVALKRKKKLHKMASGVPAVMQ